MMMELLLIALGAGAIIYLVTKSSSPSVAPATVPAPATRASEEPAGTRACGVAVYTSPKTPDTSLATFYASPPLLGAASKSPEVVAMTLSQKVDDALDKKTVDARAAAVREYAIAAECAGWVEAASDLYVFSDWLLSIEFDAAGKVTFIPPAPKSYTGPAIPIKSEPASESTLPASEPPLESSPASESSTPLTPAYSPTSPGYGYSGTPDASAPAGGSGGSGGGGGAPYSPVSSGSTTATGF